MYVRGIVSLDILKTIARDKQVVTFDEVYAKTGIKKDILSTILSRLEERGLVERLERGKYLIIPLGSEKGSYTLHEFVIGTALLKDSAIAYWSALHAYGLTEQIPGKVFVQTPGRKKKTSFDLFGVQYQIVRITGDKFFGLRQEWIENTPVPITDREKTIIDCLDKPQYAGGIGEVTKAFLSSTGKQRQFDPAKLIDYASRIKNVAVMRRLGFISDLRGLSLRIPRPRSNKYLLLDPTMPPGGENNARWRLRINVDLTSRDV